MRWRGVHLSNTERLFLLFVFVIVQFGFLLVYLSFSQRIDLSKTIIGERTVDLTPFTTAAFPNLFWGVFFALVFLVSHLLIRWKLPNSDPLLLPLSAFLAGIGLVVLYRLGPDIAIAHNKIGYLSQLRGQFRWLILAVASMMFVIWWLTPKRLYLLSRWRYIYMLLSFLILGALILKRKFGIPLPFERTQGIELIKLLSVFFIAGYFKDKSHVIDSRDIFGIHFPRLAHTAAFFLMSALALGLVVPLQDFGFVALLFVLLLVMFVVGTSLRSILILGFGMLLIVGITAYFLEKPLILKERVDIWLNPFSQSENSAYSLWAISAGGLFGTGLGRGMPHAIPNAWADFNFSSICEEFGFIGGAIVILAFWLILHRCYSIATQREDTYGKLLSIGFMVALAVQGLLIAAGNMNLVPLTGITLPFVSHGGSSLLVSFIMVGILLRLSATNK